MTSSDSEDRLDGEFSRLLAAYDESLASGQSTSLDDAALFGGTTRPCFCGKLEAACECLRQLERNGSLVRPVDAIVVRLRSGRFAGFSRGGLRADVAASRNPAPAGAGRTRGCVPRVRYAAASAGAGELPRPDSLMTPRLRERFLREARATAVLKHPNLITVYDAGEAGPLCYIAEAYCDGPNLSTWLQQQREPVPPRLAADLVRKLAAAVAHAHACGIIHRDLKPSNVLLEPCLLGREQTSLEDKETLPFVPKVTDFGLAKLLDTDGEQGATVTLSICGTAPYMAPEQAEGRRDAIGPAPTDMYALGVLLYEILTGQTPFRGAAAREYFCGGSCSTTRRLRPAAAGNPPRPRGDLPQVPRETSRPAVRVG